MTYLESGFLVFYIKKRQLTTERCWAMLFNHDLLIRMFHFHYLCRDLHPAGCVVKTMKIPRVPNLYSFFFNMLILSLKHLTTLRLNGSPTGGAMDKGIFVKFKEKLHYAFFPIATNTLAASIYYHK